jgi:BirA family biotin operon repressor/biotin-[acetyl-CoA-carboxylase] ligase
MDRVLSLLVRSHDYISGQEIAEKEKMSRAAVWKHIKKARESGFIVSSSHNRGYRIDEFPENRIVPELVDFYYKGTLSFELIYVESLRSTNTYAKELILKGKDNSFIVLTDEQTEGRGRYERAWSSESGKDLTFSIALKSERRLNEFYKYTVISGLSVFTALSDTLRQHGNTSEIKIKWPNDIMIGNRKICGMLSEMITEEQTIGSLVIGIGININSSPDIKEAVSLKNIIHTVTDRNSLMAKIIAVFEDNYRRFEKGLYGEIFREWKLNLGWLGKRVSFNNGKSIIAGILKNIDENGAVIIRSNGGDKTFYSGDLLIDN